jgi:hypothetical protein
MISPCFLFSNDTFVTRFIFSSVEIMHSEPTRRDPHLITLALSIHELMINKRSSKLFHEFIWFLSNHSGRDVLESSCVLF